jgi:HAD superfamily hydrolase (TIGR01509 family)
MSAMTQPVARGADADRRIAAVLFDWDGTLSDSRAALLASWHESTQAVLGRKYPGDATQEDIVFTKPGSEIWPAIARDREEAARLAEAFQAAYERHSSTVRAFPGVFDMLVALRAAGIVIGVVTSKGRRRYEPDASLIGIAGNIDVAVCAGEAPPKPDPAGLTEALRQLGSESDRAAMVGDTVVDIEAALRAGAIPVGVGWGHGHRDELLAAGARAVARTPAELRRMLTQGLVDGRAPA